MGFNEIIQLSKLLNKKQMEFLEVGLFMTLLGIY